MEIKREKYAWEEVSRFVKEKKENKEEKKRFRAILRKLPALIVNNGLGQTLAFLLSKGKDGKSVEGKVYEILEKWVCDHKKTCLENNPSLMLSIMEGNSIQCMHATMEILQLSIWLKRFAEALIEEEGDER